MSANTPEITQTSASPFQSWIFRFVALIALSLIIIPILPMLLSNLIYSFSGDAPKIYWYLSRASGFVTLTILWAAMAMGLGITNRIARLWPGAPTAFSIHQYTSLLGLAFAAYHGLVLMGDHYTDFSLPRLITPFSIAYKTVWIGLGQTSFYVWMLVVASFYIRQHIGQNVWRLIHYVNFAVYVAGFLHAAFSGTDSNAPWARAYFWVSGISILALLAYRIYESGLKGKLKLPLFSKKHQQATMVEASTAVKAANLPEALIREQSRIPVPPPAPATKEPASEKPPIPAMTGVIAKAMEETPAPAPKKEKPAPQANPVEQPVPAKPSSPIETIHDDSRGSKIRVRIFKEPTTLPIPKFETTENETDEEIRALYIRVKQSFRGMPIEPSSPKRRDPKVIFSDD